MTILLVLNVKEGVRTPTWTTGKEEPYLHPDRHVYTLHVRSPADRSQATSVATQEDDPVGDTDTATRRRNLGPPRCVTGVETPRPPESQQSVLCEPVCTELPPPCSDHAVVVWFRSGPRAGFVLSNEAGRVAGTRGPGYDGGEVSRLPTTPHRALSASRHSPSSRDSTPGPVSGVSPRRTTARRGPTHTAPDHPRRPVSHHGRRGSR